MQIRPAQPDEFTALGRLLVDAYAALPGMPSPDEQPDYYAMLRDVAARAANPAITVLVAIRDGRPIGCVDFIADVAHYGAGGVAASVPGAAGIRLLAVDPGHRGRGAGAALTRACIERARILGKSKIVLHTTRAMATAWALYERIGFRRYPEIDFLQGRLEVFGFVLDVIGPARETTAPARRPTVPSGSRR